VLPLLAVVVAAQTLSFRIEGLGRSIPTQVDSGPCPEGEWADALFAAARPKRAGTAYGCGLAISKRDVPGYGLRWIRQRARVTYIVPGGTIRTIESQTYSFARDQHHSRASGRGRIVGGTGTYAGARGTVSFGGVAVDGRADYRLELALR
jgi:hypothetical protein